jgi:RNA polymerase sigma-70 factor (ECF subfamily)
MVLSLGSTALLQDSLVRALSGWRGRRCNGNLRAWLYTIVYNGFVTDQRRRRLRQICCPSLTEVVENDLPGVDGGQETLLAYRDLRRGLADLPDDQRVVLLLISVEDFSYEEAARILGVPIGTVMSRLSRGRERLRQYMNGNWVQTRSLRPKRQRLLRTLAVLLFVASDSRLGTQGFYPLPALRPAIDIACSFCQKG